jgi:hypothetical protein
MTSVIFRVFAVQVLVKEGLGCQGCEREAGGSGRKQASAAAGQLTVTAKKSRRIQDYAHVAR